MADLRDRSWWQAVLTATVCVLTHAGSASSEDPAAIRLAYKFNPGQFIHTEVVNKASIESKFQGMVETAVNESRSSKHFRVVSVDEQGRAVLEPMIDRVEMTIQISDGAPLTYDSQIDSTPLPQFQPIHITVGKPSERLTVLPSGRRMRPATAENTAPVVVPEHEAQMSILVIFPDEPVAIGGVWKNSFVTTASLSEGKLTQQVTIQRKYKLERIADSIATISLQSAVIAPQLTPTIESQVAQRLLQGTIEFDWQRGLVLSQQLSVDRTIVDAFGPQTLLTCKCITQERLVAGPQAAAAPPRPLK